MHRGGHRRSSHRISKKNARSFTSNHGRIRNGKSYWVWQLPFRRTDPSPLQLQNQPLFRTQPSRQQHQLSTILPLLILSGTSIASLSLPNRNLPKVVWAHSEFMSIENLKTFGELLSLLSLCLLASCACLRPHHAYSCTHCTSSAVCERGCNSQRVLFPPSRAFCR